MQILLFKEKTKQFFSLLKFTFTVLIKKRERLKIARFLIFFTNMQTIRKADPTKDSSPYSLDHWALVGHKKNTNKSCVFCYPPLYLWIYPTFLPFYPLNNNPVRATAPKSPSEFLWSLSLQINNLNRYTMLATQLYFWHHRQVPVACQTMNPVNGSVHSKVSMHSELEHVILFPSRAVSSLIK